METNINATAPLWRVMDRTPLVVGSSITRLFTGIAEPEGGEALVVGSSTSGLSTGIAEPGGEDALVVGSSEGGETLVVGSSIIAEGGPEGGIAEGGPEGIEVGMVEGLAEGA
jgi:hypothetical protein